MSKRRRVPKALQAELTEYASLLRALRANDTLDITSQLTRYQQKGKARAWDEDEDEDEDEDNIGMEDDDYELDNRRTLTPNNDEEDELASGRSNYMEQSQSSRPSSPSQVPSKRKHTQSPASSRARLKRARKTPRKASPRKTRDTWTRWPLLLEDVPVPEWSLEDEVGLIVEMLFKQSVQQQRQPSKAGSGVSGSPRHTSTSPFPSSTHGSDIDMDDEITSDSDLELGGDSPFISSLALSTSSYLQFILAAVSAILPKRAPSMQNRLAPVDWECVLEALVACGRVDSSNSSENRVSEKVLSNVRYRMQAITNVTSTGVSLPSVEEQGAPTAVVLTSPRVIAQPTAATQQEDTAVTDFLQSSPVPPTPISQPLTNNSPLSLYRMQRVLASKRKLSQALSRYGATEEAILFCPPFVPFPENHKDEVQRPRRKRAYKKRAPKQSIKKPKEADKQDKSTEYADDSDENLEHALPEDDGVHDSSVGGDSYAVDTDDDEYDPDDD